MYNNVMLLRIANERLAAVVWPGPWRNQRPARIGWSSLVRAMSPWRTAPTSLTTPTGRWVRTTTTTTTREITASTRGVVNAKRSRMPYDQTDFPSAVGRSNQLYPAHLCRPVPSRATNAHHNSQACERHKNYENQH